MQSISVATPAKLDCYASSTIRQVHAFVSAMETVYLINAQYHFRDIAAVSGRRVNDFGPVRQSLLTKGMIWSSHHGETAFTVPLFDDFMMRTMPNDE